MKIDLTENNLRLCIEVNTDRAVYLLYLGQMDKYNPERHACEGKSVAELKRFVLVELQITGYATIYHHGNKHTGTSPACMLTYMTHRDTRNPFGRKIEVVQGHGMIEVVSHIQFYDGIPVVRSWTEIANKGDPLLPIEYVSSFSLTGLCIDDPNRRDEGHMHIPHSTWYGECQWRSYSLHDLGYYVVTDASTGHSMKRISLSNTGSWPCGEHLPMGSYEEIAFDKTVTWQIETAGSWNWETSDTGNELYLQISGPSFQENGFLKKLKKGEAFTTVQCAVAFVNGDFAESIRALTLYRRRIRRVNNDNAHPKVIFNDYMNCLWGDPTTEREIPLIDAAAEAGCDYYCVDCGWYADGFWWDEVGEWLPSGKRFPGGIREVLDYIRSKGMIPGLWLELEVMGIKSPMVSRVDPDWFFKRNGFPVIDEGRYQLDFRNPEVRAHADEVIRRLVEDYGVGYIKNDYNINAGVGTDTAADSAGDGLLQHTRAWLDWLDGVFLKYPDLVIENCGSGGMRMEYSLLSRCSIQSVTDQTDYLKMAAIAANCVSAVAPEQAAIWSYPLRAGDPEEVVFNMINAMLLRIHQSGHLAELESGRADLVREGIRVHKEICPDIAEGLPFWPLGLAKMSDDFCALGIECGSRGYLAVWHVRGDSDLVTIPVLQGNNRSKVVRCVYPSSMPCAYSFDRDSSVLSVTLHSATARLFRIDLA